MTQPLRRWSGTELPRELNDVLSSADGDASAQALDRVRARLSEALGPAFEIAHPPPTAATQPLLRMLHVVSPGKWLGLGALVVLGFGVFWLQGSGESGESTAARQTAAHAPAAEQIAPPSAAAEPRPGTLAAADTPATLIAAEGSEAPIASETPIAAEGSETSAAAADVEGAAVPAEGRKAAGGVPARAPQVQPRAAGPAKRPVARSKAPELGLAEELRQLNQIRQELHKFPAQALIEADTHARHFPHGTLGPERELLRVDALIRLGREAEARKLAEKMLAAPAGHPYRAQLEKLLSKQ